VQGLILDVSIVVLMWVSGHVGLAGNSAAQNAAKADKGHYALNK